MPLFPYDSAGAIVPCGAVLVGGPDMEYGHFFHWNTVNEVVVTYGANKAMLAAGQIFVTQQLHGVNSFLRDEKDPEAFALMVITQHQSTSGDQREARLARCKKCKAELARHDYDATPHGLPGYDPDNYGADDDPVRQFATTYQSVAFVALRNSDEGRTCAKCGHVNDPFPAERWGWDQAGLPDQGGQRRLPHPGGGRVMNRRRMLHALKAEVGEYEDAAVLPAETDPQLHLSKNRQPQPFHLICAKDNVLSPAVRGGARPLAGQLREPLPGRRRRPRVHPGGHPAPDRARRRGRHDPLPAAGSRAAGRGVVLRRVRQRVAAV